MAQSKEVTVVFADDVVMGVVVVKGEYMLMNRVYEIDERVTNWMESRGLLVVEMK